MSPRLLACLQLLVRDGWYRQKGTCRVMSCHRGARCLSSCVTTSSASNCNSLFQWILSRPVAENFSFCQYVSPPAAVCVCDSSFVLLVLSCSAASVASCAPVGPLASPPASCEGPWRRPVPRQPCRRRSAGRSRGRRPRGRRSSPWRPFACRVASGRSSGTEGSKVNGNSHNMLFKSLLHRKILHCAKKWHTCINGQYMRPVWNRKRLKVMTSVVGVTP